MKPTFKQAMGMQVTLNVPLGIAMSVVASICSNALGVTTIPMSVIGIVVAIVLRKIYFTYSKFNG